MWNESYHRADPGILRLGLGLPRIAPQHLGYTDQRQDCAINRPMIVADHEPAAEGQVEALEDPDSAH